MGNTTCNVRPPHPPPISSPSKPITVRTRFNTARADAPRTQGWRAVDYALQVAAHGHAMSCVEEGKVVMVGGSRKYPTVNCHIIDLVFFYIYFVVLFCFVLFCFVLFCFVLFCFVLFCFVLFCFVLFCLFY